MKPSSKTNHPTASCELPARFTRTAEAIREEFKRKVLQSLEAKPADLSDAEHLAKAAGDPNDPAKQTNRAPDGVDASSIAKYRQQFEASRGFELQDDSDFCPYFVTEDDRPSVTHEAPAQPTQTAAISKYRQQHEAARGFDLEDDLDFCPYFVTDEDLTTVSHEIRVQSSQIEDDLRDLELLKAKLSGKPADVTK